jgi:nicotinamide mononucleotide (NMN) deamidase PncC
MRVLGFRDTVESMLAGVATGASEDGAIELEGVAGNGGSGR